MARAFKRQFQPSIDSFFHARTDACPDSQPTATSPAPSPTSAAVPRLPHSVQSSLLSVGMRVRKSVPDGYQTSNKYTQACLAPGAVAIVGASQEDGASGLPLYNTSATAYRGLLPYCGIMKVGGHASQPVPEEDDVPPLQFDDEWSLPSGSQESTSSISTTAATAHTAPTTIFSAQISQSSPPTRTQMGKRRREDADDEDLGLEAQPVSPRSRPVSHTRMPNLDQVRPIALPRSRRKSAFTYDDDGGGAQGGGIGGDNGAGGLQESEMIDVADFEEARFLQPNVWMKDWQDV